MPVEKDDPDRPTSVIGPDRPWLLVVLAFPGSRLLQADLDFQTPRLILRTVASVPSAACFRASASFSYSFNVSTQPV